MDKSKTPIAKSVSPQVRRKFLHLLAEMDDEVGERSVIKTCADYHPGRPMSNAEVFIELSDWTFHGMEDTGIFCEKNSAGVLPFHSLVETLMQTDKHHRLSVNDAREAVAMLYHLTPPLITIAQNGDEFD